MHERNLFLHKNAVSDLLKSMFFVLRTYVLSRKNVCFLSEKAMLSFRKIILLAGKGRFSSFVVAFLFYLKCKYFDILLNVREKALFVSVVSFHLFLEAERNDSRTFGKAKCQKLTF